MKNSPTRVPPSNVDEVHQTYFKYEKDHFPIGCWLSCSTSNKNQQGWKHELPIQVRGLVLAGDRLFTAGTTDAVTVAPFDAPTATEKSVLQSWNAVDGSKLAEVVLPAPPVFDGLIAAGNHLYMSAADGTLTCFGP